jgi:ribose 5-phosphate isomerase B
MIGELVAEQIAKVWLKTEFAGGRHQNRVDKINNTEKKYFK